MRIFLIVSYTANWMAGLQHKSRLDDMPAHNLAYPSSLMILRITSAIPLYCPPAAQAKTRYTQHTNGAHTGTQFGRASREIRGARRRRCRASGTICLT